MAGGKETPRQKMIGMMYLVLLALLAMNVTKSVLNSFVIINGAMTETNEAFAQKNEATMAEFASQNSQNEAKVLPFYNKAKAVHKASQELDKYFEDLKKHIISKVEGYDPALLEGNTDWITLDTVQALGDIDMAQTIMIGPDLGTPKSGEWTMLEMKDKIKEWEDIVISQFPKSQQASLEDIRFEYKDGVDKDGNPEPWHQAHFYHAPIAAVITDITMFQNQVKNSESRALGLLMDNIDAGDFKFSNIEVKVIPKSNYVVLGDSFKAQLIVAAYDTTQPPVVITGSELDTAGKAMADWGVKNAFDSNRVSIVDGVAQYGFKPTSEGEQKWGGIVKLKKPGTNEYNFYPFESTFIAAKASAVVSPVKMNVFYRGAKNDVEVSVAGFSASKVDIQVTNATKTGSNGKYIVKPGQGRECSVTVYVTKDDGSKIKVGEARKFRVEPIPPATPKFATVAGSGKVTKAQVLASGKVTAKLENFLLNDESLKVKVTAFTMKVPVKGKYIPYRSKNDKVTPQMKTALKNLRKGSVIIIDGIKTSTGGQPEKGIKGNIIVEIK
ncbi:hypothetical protein KFE94_10540 [bacterium SCSIO 12643]|nr:hypothetical protein KFE94_10540 [bacterium SCSIO 12643]